MKKCPICNLIFSDDEVFCINDGATLLFESETGEKSFNFQTADNAATKVVLHPQISSPSVAHNSSKWLYLTVGAMAATIFALGIVFYFSRSANEKETVSSVKQNEKTSNNTTEIFSPSANQNSGKTENSTTNVSPNGKWTGNLSYPWGEAHSAQIDLTDNGNGQVSGQVVWICTANPKMTDEIGMRQIEIARGNFDAATRTISMESYEKDNPNKLACRFQFTLTEDNSYLNGFVFGKRGSRWNLNLRRF